MKLFLFTRFSLHCELNFGKEARRCFWWPSLYTHAAHEKSTKTFFRRRWSWMMKGRRRSHAKGMKEGSTLLSLIRHHFQRSNEEQINENVREKRMIDVNVRSLMLCVASISLIKQFFMKRNYTAKHKLSTFRAWVSSASTVFKSNRVCFSRFAHRWIASKEIKWNIREENSYNLPSICHLLTIFNRSLTLNFFQFILAQFSLSFNVLFHSLFASTSHIRPLLQLLHQTWFLIF